MRNLAKVFMVFLFPGFCLAQSGAGFDEFFVNKTLRIDYYHVGHAKEEIVTLDRTCAQGIWAGSVKNLLDPFNAGRYSVKIFDAASGKLVYSKGFDSYFGEYKTSDAALRGIRRTYHESALVPFPKKKIRFVLEARDREKGFQPVFSQEIDPSGTDINRENPVRDVKVYELIKSGDPHRKVDVAFIAEGYTLKEEEKLKTDLDRFLKVFFGQEPYKSRKSSFNVYGVFKPSDESGCDEPSHGQYKATTLNSTFDSLGSERYLLTEDNRSLHDIAARVPYDTLCIMINHKRYGGGGIYNFFCTFTADNQWQEYLFLHEFGHSFAGLADEYYTSQVAYNEFYPRGVEPAEPNITALLNPRNLKWKSLASPGIEIPTPWEKDEFDKMDNGLQKIRQEVNAKVARLKREGAPKEEVEKEEAEAERLSLEHARRVDAYLRKSRYAGKIGAFEGAGYAAQGLYRPAIDCIMFTKGAKPFCEVCAQAIIRVIDTYCE
ncbi:MAG: M64 family metallopeptidase [Acidobacteriota bacterium]|nr:M64 family metallopeptidase [Acidobacteriota bacterium]